MAIFNLQNKTMMINIAGFFIFLLIFLNIFPASFTYAIVDINHFFSSQHLFEYASYHGFQYGIDLIDNVGPYGYLHYPYTYLGNVFWSKILWFSFLCFVYAYYATLLTNSIHAWYAKLLFLCTVLFFPLQISLPWYSYEIVPRLAILFSALCLLSELGKHGKTYIIFNGFFYAFLTLEKASNVYYIILVIFLLSMLWIQQYQWRNLLYLISSFLFGVVLFWLAIGQQISNLPAYFKSMSLFIDAYQAVLEQKMDVTDFYYALFYVGIFSILFICRALISFIITRKFFTAETFRSILVAALFFLSWKHGMMRSTLSYGTFFYAVPVLFAYTCLYPITPLTKEKTPSQEGFFSRYLLLLSVLLFSLLLYVIWSNNVYYAHKASIPVDFTHEMNGRYSALTHYHPWQIHKKLASEYEKLKSENSLPLSLKKIIQFDRVDEFGSVPEILLLNNLNYRPRPIPIDFIVANSQLNKRNGQFYQNQKTAPDFIFIQDFGHRLLDTSAYLSLIFNYQAIQIFQNWFIMQKHANWQNIKLKRLSHKEAHLNHWISLKNFQNTFLWLNIDANFTILGKLKNVLYIQDYLNLDLMLEDNSLQTFPISLSQLKGGFLVNPMIKTKDRLWLFGDHKSDIPWFLVKAFRISVNSEAPWQNYLFHQKIKIFYSEILTRSSSDRDFLPVNLIRASKLINLFAPSFPINLTSFPINLITNEVRNDLHVEGLCPIESNGKESWRWGVGKETSLKFYIDPNSSHSTKPLLLNAAFKNGVPVTGQSVTVYFNDRVVAYVPTEELGIQKLITLNLTLVPQKTLNTLKFVYQDCNHGKKDYSESKDPRQLALVFTHLSLQKKSP